MFRVPSSTSVFVFFFFFSAQTVKDSCKDSLRKEALFVLYLTEIICNPLEITGNIPALTGTRSRVRVISSL